MLRCDRLTQILRSFVLFRFVDRARGAVQYQPAVFSPSPRQYYVEQLTIIEGAGAMQFLQLETDVLVCDMRVCVRYVYLR